MQMMSLSCLHQQWSFRSLGKLQLAVGSRVDRKATKLSYPSFLFWKWSNKLYDNERLLDKTKFIFKIWNKADIKSIQLWPHWTNCSLSENCTLNSFLIIQFCVFLPSVPFTHLFVYFIIMWPQSNSLENSKTRIKPIALTNFWHRVSFM